MSMNAQETRASYLLLESTRPPYNTIRGPLSSFTPSLQHWLDRGWVDVTRHRLGTRRPCPMCEQFRKLTGGTREEFWIAGWDAVADRQEFVLWCDRTPDSVAVKPSLMELRVNKHD